MDSNHALEKEALSVEQQEARKASKNTRFSAIFKQGIWHNNSALVQLLGLCPLLAVSNSATNALGLGLATMLVLVFTNGIVALFRHHIPQAIRIPIYVVIIATTVTAVQLLMNAYTYHLYQSLGIFIPLIVTNCIVIGRAEAFAYKHSVISALFDGLSMGLGMVWVLFLLGALREIFGTGKLFIGIENLLGEWATILHVDILHLEHSFLFAILPPGAFLGLALLLALKNALDHKMKK